MSRPTYSTVMSIPLRSALSCDGGSSDLVVALAQRVVLHRSTHRVGESTVGVCDSPTLVVAAAKSNLFPVKEESLFKLK